MSFLNQADPEALNVEPQSLSERVYNYLKEQILSGAIEGGERIPEERVGRLFGISRTPIREAIKRLEEYGLVRVKPRSYAEVVSLDDRSAVQITQVRAQLEELAVRLFVECAAEEDFAALEQLVRQCDAALSAGAIAETFMQDSLLHLELSRRCCNPHLHDVLQRLDARVQLARLQVHLPPAILAQFVAQHHTLMDAMRARDAERAAAVMRSHILDQLQHLKR